MTPLSTWRVVVALAVLLSICVAVLSLARVRVRRDAFVAAGRAAVQLLLVALVIAWVFVHPEAVVLYLGVMLGAAAWTSTRRVGLGRSVLPVLALAITAGAASAVVP